MSNGFMGRPADEPDRIGSGLGGDGAIAGAVTLTLTDKAYRIIEEMIATLQLRPGSLVSESALSEQIGIGRTPIREALQRLAQESLIVTLPRRGAMVAEVNVSRQLRLVEVRREIERLLARSAARRATPAERGALRGIADGMMSAAAAGDDIGFMRLDGAFNAQVRRSARNEFASRTLGLMESLSRRFWYIHYRQIGDIGRMADLHAGVALGVAEGDPERAAEASDALMDYVDAFTRAAATEI